LVEFGEVLRGLRSQKGLGIKRLAPDLGITYSYLSKLEKNVVRPSDDLVDRVATYFSYDRDLLLLSASRVPPDVLRLLRDHPEEALAYLRDRFGSRAVGGPETRAAPSNDRKQTGD
jgi:transcriptional regulator with XRE-family HTH domain